MKKSKEILVIAPFPEPLHGQSLASSNLVERLKAHGVEVIIHNTNGKGFAKVFQHLTAAARLLVHRKNIYISVNSNTGMFLSAILAGAARLVRSSRVYLHHHSYSHVRDRSLNARFLAGFAGPNATHIVLSNGMGVLLKSQYASVKRVMVINNAGLVSDKEPRELARKDGLIKLGFLGNITLAKGFDSAIETLAAGVDAGMVLNLVVAGPVQDPESRRVLDEGVTRFGSLLEYRGPVRGEAKNKFFDDIDILLFPSRYRNEASPLVIYESLARGVPVIASSIGCISEDLLPDGGFVLSSAFPSACVGHLRDVTNENATFRQRARLQYERKLSDYMSQIDDFVQSLSAGIRGKDGSG